MTKPRVVEVESLSGFAKEIEDWLKKTRERNPGADDVVNWYRGHGSSTKYTLLPSLYRHPVTKDLSSLLNLERKMGLAFRRQGMLHSFPVSGLEDQESITQLFYMQHNGVPTRLLDWSNNPFISLYFALSDAQRNTKGKYATPAAVWILDPFSWNAQALQELGWGNQGPADAADNRIKSYRPDSTSTPMDMYPLPIALVGAANTPRMLAQRGAFTIFGSDLRAMEQLYDKQGFPEDCLVKLEIPANAIGEIMTTLVAVGYTDSVAYPDLQGLAMEIKRANGFSS